MFDERVEGFLPKQNFWRESYVLNFVCVWCKNHLIYYFVCKIKSHNKIQNVEFFIKPDNKILI